ncbi:Lrp/AsnC ligand binding domain-containing protein, partial [Klebsiella pneumoniae]|uniref:Lrp/AsnC ligand binding domain-containing protein n=1 Tax=Klebsiella pneumoniae TaxID=573 RepID=UPI001C4E1B86
LKSQEAAVVDQFVEAIKEMPEVVECQLMAGDCDFFLRIVVADLDAYRKFQIHHLTQIPCIQSVKTDSRFFYADSFRADKNLGLQHAHFRD